MTGPTTAPTVRFADLTTLRVGGPAGRFVEAHTEQDLLAAVRDADASGTPALVVGGGSNLLVADAGFPGTVVAVRTRGVHAVPGPAGVDLQIAAGEPWDALVARAVDEGLAGIEALSGIPGLAGATPIQNVGAYGQALADVITQVRVFDRVTGGLRTFTTAECGFGYRSSRFKAEPYRYVVLAVTLRLRRCTSGGPIRYAELARALGVADGANAPLPEVRNAVLALRASKGMVLDPADHDTWSAGSFFTNPILETAQAERLPAQAPRFAQPDGRVKTSAAWLIEHAGFHRGYALPGSRAAVSGKHTLALTNRGGATADEVLALARHLREGVRAAYGVELVPEPVLAGWDRPLDH